MTSYLIDKKDLQHIVSCAKDKMFYLKMPINVSGVEVDRGEMPTIAILESVLMFLNSKKLLTNLVELDYTDPCADHDCDIPDLEERKPVK